MIIYLKRHLILKFKTNANSSLRRLKNANSILREWTLHTSEKREQRLRRLRFKKKFSKKILKRGRITEKKELSRGVHSAIKNLALRKRRKLTLELKRHL